jgi:hypothetical protein
MIYQINEAFLPYIFNSDPSGLEDAEVQTIDLWQETEKVDLSRCSVIENKDGEWITNFSPCDITGIMSKVVYLTDSYDDYEAFIRQE